MTEDISTKHSSQQVLSEYDEYDLDDDIGTMDALSISKFDIVSHEKTYENYKLSKKKSLPYITKYEKAKILSIRAQQIASGSVAMIPVKDKISIREIVKEEYKQKKIPLILRRYLPNGSYEDWKLTDFLNIN